MDCREATGNGQNPAFMAGIDRGVLKMNTQQIYETASELLAGAVFDMEQISVDDVALLTDILANQDFALRVKPEFSLVYAVPETYLH